MHRSRGTLQPGAEVHTERLVTKAHAQERQAASQRGADPVERLAGGVWVAGPWPEHQMGRRGQGGVCGAIRRRSLAVIHHRDLGAEHAQVVDDVVAEGVVTLDEQHLSGAAPARSRRRPGVVAHRRRRLAPPRAPASTCSSASALCRVSKYSLAGSLPMTMPPPAEMWPLAAGHREAADEDVEVAAVGRET